MNDQIKKRIKRTAILAVFGLAIGLGVGWYQIQMQNARVVNMGPTGEPSGSGMAIAGLNVGGSFSLVNDQGEAVTEEDYADHYKLVFFGFTFCPDICPTELQKITNVMNKLGDQAEMVQPLFITIDPMRDTPEVLDQYLDSFHPEIVGLTGTEPQVDIAIKNYKVFATKVESEELSDYTMDHSSFTYLMSPDNKLISIYRMDDDADFMAKDIRRYLPENPVL